MAPEFNPAIDMSAAHIILVELCGRYSCPPCRRYRHSHCTGPTVWEVQLITHTVLCGRYMQVLTLYCVGGIGTHSHCIGPTVLEVLLHH